MFFPLQSVSPLHVGSIGPHSYGGNIGECKEAKSTKAIRTRATRESTPLFRILCIPKLSCACKGHTHSGQPFLSAGVIERKVPSLCHSNFTGHASFFLLSSPLSQSFSENRLVVLCRRQNCSSLVKLPKWYAYNV